MSVRRKVWNKISGCSIMTLPRLEAGCFSYLAGNLFRGNWAKRWWPGGFSRSESVLGDGNNLLLRILQTEYCYQRVKSLNSWPSEPSIQKCFTWWKGPLVIPKHCVVFLWSKKAIWITLIHSVLLQYFNGFNGIAMPLYVTASHLFGGNSEHAGILFLVILWLRVCQTSSSQSFLYYPSVF